MRQGEYSVRSVPQWPSPSRAFENLVQPLHSARGLGTRETPLPFSTHAHTALPAYMHVTLPLYSAALWKHRGHAAPEPENLLRTKLSRDDARSGRGSRSGCNSLSLDLLPPHSMACTAGHGFLIFARQSHDAFNLWLRACHIDAAGTARRLTRDLVV